MNIYFLHEDPKKCAQYHTDKHVAGMLSVYATILCNVFHVFIKRALKRRSLGKEERSQIRALQSKLPYQPYKLSNKDVGS